MPKEFARLPTNVKPIHYQVDLQPNLQNFEITGYTKIDLQISEPVNQIKCNALEIEVSDAIINSSLKASAIDYDADNEAVIFKFDSDLPVGEASLELNFKAIVNDKLKGFYRSKYLTEDKTEKNCAVTQFESTDARRCFPCWDEPAVKATFTCSLTIEKELLGLSNMPVVAETEEKNGLKKLQFEKSPIMSTYLLAFYVGESEFVEGHTKYGVKCRVYTPLGKKSHGDFALDMGIKSLEYYEDYFNIKFPLPKLDQIGLDDFSAGAMENWGLVTYRSNCLLIDPVNSSNAVKERVAIVVAHELAHQWFGNLVTMEWWTHLWLNEGFASFMEYLCVDSIHPDYNIFDVFVKNDFSMGMELDALDSSHPIEVPVNHPSEVDEIFDHISYCKGSSVIRMLHSWISDANFRTGMADYLTKYAYKNALTEQLWEALGNASNMPVAEVMSTWTSQTGFPLVTVEDLGNNQLKLTQSKYSANGPKHVENDTTLWQIPIQVCDSENPTQVTQTVLLKEKSMTITTSNTATWTKINCGAVGFYRVQYAPEYAAKFETEKLMVRDRLQLQSDTFALCKAGYIPLTDYFNLLDAYKSETDYTVMADILKNLGEINLLARNLSENVQNKLKLWRNDFLQNLKNKLGWEKLESDSHGDVLLRSTVIDTLGKSGDAEIVATSRKMFADHLAKTQEIPGDLRSAVYATVAANAENVEDIEKLIQLWRDNKDSQEQQAIVERSIGYVQSETNIQKVMEFIQNDVKMCNVPFAYVGLCYGSNAGAEATWSYIKNNLKEILHNCMGFLRQAMFARTICVFGTSEKCDEIKKFFWEDQSEEVTKELPERALNQMLEKIKIRSEMLERDGDNLEKFFS